MADGTISIVIPVLNEAENISPLLRSFDALVKEGGLDQLREIIFVDDGSSDGTVPHIKQEVELHP